MGAAEHVPPNKRTEPGDALRWDGGATVDFGREDSIPPCYAIS